MKNEPAHGVHSVGGLLSGTTFTPAVEANESLVGNVTDQGRSKSKIWQTAH